MAKPRKAVQLGLGELRSLPKARNGHIGPGEAPPKACLSEEMNLWEEILARIETKVNRHSFYTWFKPTTFVAEGTGAIIVRVPNPLFTDWLTKHYKPNVDGYLFTNSKGKTYLSDNVVKYGVHRAMAKLGIETAKGVHVGIHCFRHGVTSELLESGTPIHVVTRLMRHADSHVTLEHYAHIVGDAERVASEKFSQRIGQNIAQLESDSELESTSSVKTA